MTFEIRGTKHVTFPNPDHVSVRVIYEDGSISEWLHLSQDENGNGYDQALVIGMGNKNKNKNKNKNYTNIKKFKNLKALKTLKTLRKNTRK